MGLDWKVQQSHTTLAPSFAMGNYRWPVADLDQAASKLAAGVV
jgi:hypothetical protein